jgi:hypothetical protein
VLGTLELFNLWRSATGQFAFQTVNGKLHYRRRWRRPDLRRDPHRRR